VLPEDILQHLASFLHLNHGRRLYGYRLYRDCLKTSYEYMKPAYAGSIKDQCAADMVHRSSDISRPHECSTIDQQSQYRGPAELVSWTSRASIRD